jgi:uncharacterized RDD family membrane protein YckC
MTEQQPSPYDPEQIHQSMQQGYPPAPPPPGYDQAPQSGWGQPATAYGVPAPYAEWIKRVGATLVDAAVLIPTYILIGIGAVVAGGGDASGAAGAIGTFLMILGYIAMLGVLIWNVFVRQGRTGWSIGKQVLGIRLIGERTGQPIGAGLAFVRAICHIVDQVLCYVGYLWPLWDTKKQTFADKIMSTVVIEQKRG